jgi:hypothetical protein
MYLWVVFSIYNNKYVTVINSSSYSRVSIAATSLLALFVSAIGTAFVPTFVAIKRLTLLAFVDSHVIAAKEPSAGLFAAIRTLIEFCHS